MRKDWKYIVYIALAVGVFIGVKMFMPKQYNWVVTFAEQDKNPYGGFALADVLNSLFNEDKVAHSYKTVYEIKDSIAASDNVLIVASSFSGGKEDSDVLLRHVDKGGHVFISAEYFSGHFADTLAVRAYDYFFKGGDILNKRDTVALKFVNVSLDTTREFYYRRDNIHNYFNKFDSTRTTVIAKNERNLPVTIRVSHGKGTFILNCTPLVFTNIYLLSRNNMDFASTMLSYLPKNRLQWTEYYQRGRMESSTPLRYILNTEPLAWAYYITVISLLLFMIFEMKRKQRIIPIIKPLANSTLEFVRTIGNLYYRRGEHKNIAEKKIHYLLDQIRTRHWMNVSHLDDNFAKTLAAKTGKSIEEVRALVKSINWIQNQTIISPEDLIDLNTKIEKFTEPV